jgi:hypothetical protein
MSSVRASTQWVSKSGTYTANKARTPRKSSIRVAVDPASATILILHLISGSNTYIFPGDVFGSEWVIYDVGGSRSMVCSVLHQQRLNPPC